MIKKNLTGQTVAIIILAILLVGAIAFAGVFAYYSSNSNKVAGKITLATLKIDFDEVGASSGTSEVLITNSSNVVPNEGMQNTPLTIINDSTKPIYLVVLYNLETRDKKGNDLNLDATPKQPVIDIGSNYDNEFYPSTNVTGRANEWQDFVYAYTKLGETETSYYRCLISTQVQTEDKITVIEKDQLKLYRGLGNTYQGIEITLKFRAYAIASDSLTTEMTSAQTERDKCNVILDAVFTSFEFDIDMN